MNHRLHPSDPILIVDDEEPILTTTKISLNISGFTNVETCSDSRAIEEMIAKRRYSVITLDLNMPYLSGQELLPMIKAIHPDTSVIVVTGAGDLEVAVSCMKNGAYDYLVKPVDKTRLVTTIQHALENEEIREENVRLKEHLLSDALNTPEAFREIITDDEAMRSIYKYVEAVAATSLPVLITGETGVGKELLARSIHYASEREGEFVAVNVAGLDDALFSDSLFGHKKGAYTGAAGDREGMISKASSGTLFLDEIGDLAVESQIKLLRLLQEKEYRPLGTDIAYSTNARFVFATNKNLEEISALGEFRTDLYYRLRSHRIHIPPLRDRPGDLPLLVDVLLDKAAMELNKKKPTPPKELYELLSVYDFPGNIRELEGMIFDAVVRHESGVLSTKHLRTAMGNPLPMQAIHTPTVPEPGENETNLYANFGQLPALKDATESLIDEAMRRANSNQTLAAKMLGMTRTALNKRLNRGS